MTFEKFIVVVDSHIVDNFNMPPSTTLVLQK